MTERAEIRPPIFYVDRSTIGIILKGREKKDIPHSDLIQATMNASAISLFGLRVVFSTQGGIEGFHKGEPISLTNAEDNLGVFNEYYDLQEEEGEGVEEVLDFYQLFLQIMFEEKMKVEGDWYPPETFLAAPALQTAEAVWIRLDNVMREVAGGSLPPRVKKIFTTSELSRKYLRGLTDDEVQAIFRNPPSV